MAEALDVLWKNSFMNTLLQCECAEPLKEAALAENLGTWTKELTHVVAKTCKSLGWHPASKGNKCSFLPIPRCEYLSLDVMAFQEKAGEWNFPHAVMELENSFKDNTIAYSLWKVICIRVPLRFVFCYRRSSTEGSSLINSLCKSVIASLPIEERMRLGGETIVVVGSRNDASTFPYGFFKWWRLNKNTGRFDLM